MLYGPTYDDHFRNVVINATCNYIFNGAIIIDSLRINSLDLALYLNDLTSILENNQSSIT